MESVIINISHQHLKQRMEAKLKQKNQNSKIVSELGET